MPCAAAIRARSIVNRAELSCKIDTHRKSPKHQTVAPFPTTHQSNDSLPIRPHLQRHAANSRYQVHQCTLSHNRKRVYSGVNQGKTVSGPYGPEVLQQQPAKQVELYTPIAAIMLHNGPTCTFNVFPNKLRSEGALSPKCSAGYSGANHSGQ